METPRNILFFSVSRVVKPIESVRQRNVAENFGGEGLNGCALLPCVLGQPGFPASLLKESNTIPVMFDRDLRQQKTTPCGHADEQAVAADFDPFGINWPRHRKDAEFDRELALFAEGHGIESRVFKRRRAGGFGDCSVERTNRQNVPDTSAQLALEM